MKILLCNLGPGIAVAAKKALAEENYTFLMAESISEAEQLMKTDAPSVVLVGGTSVLDVTSACQRLRNAKSSRHAVIVAECSHAEDVRALIEAGADDFFPKSSVEAVLRGRVFVAKRNAEIIARRESEDLDRNQFFELSLELLCIAGFDGYFKMINPAWTKLLGWPLEDFLAKPWLDFVHPDDRENTIRAGSQLEVGKTLIGFTNRYQCKDGSYRWLFWQCLPLVERSAIYAVVRDLTEDRAVKESLQTVTDNLATTLNSIADGVIATDLTGAIVSMNPVAEVLIGWTFAEAKGRPIQDTLPITNNETGLTVANPVDQAIREGINVTLPKGAIINRRDGSKIPIADSCAPIRSSSGKVSGAVFVFRDLTAQRNLEAMQAKAQQQLIFAERMASVGTLAAGVAHEINNPLSYVTANVDMAIEEIHEISGASLSGRLKDLEEMLRNAREGTSRVTKIVRGLKTFSRIEEERSSVIDLVPVIELSINMAFNEIRHRARLVKDYGGLPLVEADDARLGQVIINLLVNAAQAFPEDNTDRNEIRVITSTDAEGRAVIEIRDNGPGIAPALIERIFEPFFTTKAIGVGTGLGLAISHNIMTGMGGEIAVESEVGHGSNFRLTLSPSKPREIVPPTTKAPAILSRQGRATVLVVDDDPGVGFTIGRVLRHHEVTIVNSGKEALALLATGKKFDVVVSDLMMPEMSGIELFRKIATLYPEMGPRVVFTTGGAFTQGANQFLDEVSNKRIEKPFNSNELRALIQSFIK